MSTTGVWCSTSPHEALLDEPAVAPNPRKCLSLSVQICVLPWLNSSLSSAFLCETLCPLWFYSCLCLELCVLCALCGFIPQSPRDMFATSDDGPVFTRKICGWNDMDSGGSRCSTSPHEALLDEPAVAPNPRKCLSLSVQICVLPWLNFPVFCETDKPSAGGTIIPRRF